VVVLGKMIIESTGGMLRGIQPVYQQEEVFLKITQLKHLIISREAVMLEAELTRKAEQFFLTPTQ